MNKIWILLVFCASVVPACGIVSPAAIMARSSSTFSSLRNELCSILDTNNTVRLQEYINRGLDVAAPITDEGYTILHLAVLTAGDKRPMVRFLLGHHAPSNARAAGGNTPLHYACEMGNIGCVIELLAAGANPHQANNDGMTALHLASTYGRTSVVAFLLAQPNIQVDPIEHSCNATPLHMASIMGQVEAVKLLVAKNAQIDARNNDNATPLFLACQEGYPEIVRFLFENGASLEAPLRDGGTPLHVAASNGHLTVVQLLVSKGATIRTMKNNGATPWYAASQNGHEEVIKFFINNSYDINEKHPVSGFTALHIAALRNKLGVIKVLLNAPSIRINDPATIVTTTLDAGEEVSVSSIAMDGITLDSPTKENGYTPLHLACIWGCEEAVKQLLGHGADVTIKTRGGKTALDFAQEKGHQKIVTLFEKAKYLCAFCCEMPSKTLCCGGCKKAYYCNAVCQRKHWATHKLSCSSTAK